MESNNIEVLLAEVSAISKKYDEIARITGENFNIFSVMRMENDEVKTHSSIIAELLNPKGLHGQGEVFLKLFFHELEGLSDITDTFDFKNATVLVEQYVGPINKEYTKGGFIDIVVKDSSNQVVIENKIWAEDQKGQLLRYKNHYPYCKLIYLTPYGIEPSEISWKIDDDYKLEKEEIILVSYQNHIKNWIEKCLEKTHSQPILRESLVQYLYLLKKITNQTTNNKMSEEIVDKMIENIIVAFELEKNLPDLKTRVFKNFIKKMDNTIITLDNKEQVVIQAIQMRGDSKYGGIYFNPEGLNDLKIGLYLWKGNKYFDVDVFVGYRIEGDNNEIKNMYKETSFEVNEWWMFRNTEKPWKDNADTWLDLEKGEVRYEEIKKILKEILEIELAKD